MKVTIRLDDITSDMNWENFHRVMDILASYQIRPLLGIVPDNRDPMLSAWPKQQDFAEKMLEYQAAGVTLSMHGATHVYSTKKAGLFPLNRFSEFAGVPYETQRVVLTGAKEKLQQMGIVTDVFMAPGHTFDHNTLRVLKELGFRYVTDGFGNEPFERDGLTFFPIALQKGKAFRKLNGMTTIVLHVNPWQEKDFESFEQMLSEHAKDFVSYSEWFQRPVKRRSAVSSAREYIAATGKRVLVGLKNRK